jgi:hypothetical protein
MSSHLLIRRPTIQSQQDVSLHTYNIPLCALWEEYVCMNQATTNYDPPFSSSATLTTGPEIGERTYYRMSGLCWNVLARVATLKPLIHQMP